MRPTPLFLAAILIPAKGGDEKTAPPRQEGKAPPSRQALLDEVHRGVVLGMHSKERGFDYGPAVAEIADLGANWISLSFVALLDSVKATTIDRSSPRTPSDEDLVATIRKAKAKNLRVLLFPIVLLRNPGPDDWRGVLEPSDVEEWFRSYRDLLLHYARIGREEGVEALSIGSEYCKQEKKTSSWRQIIRAVREVFPGLLTYSANWDHYDVPEFWDDLDFVGMSSYHRLSYSKDPTVEEMAKKWEGVRHDVVKFARGLGKKIAFTEVGYPSLDDCNEYPWNYLMKNAIDLEEQADCYRAFAAAWPKQEGLQGAYFYEWWGEGGPEDRSYTPRGKPAEKVLREYFRKLSEEEPQPSR
jgi:glycosyl hydrolase family 113